MELFLLFAFYGIIAGIVYLLNSFIRELFNKNLFLTIPLDFACGIIMGLMLFRAVIFYANGEIRLYLILGFILGIFATTISFKNFVASSSNFVYNYINKAIISLKSKQHRRRKYGSSKTSENH